MILKSYCVVTEKIPQTCRSMGKKVEILGRISEFGFDNLWVAENIKKLKTLLG